MKSIPAFLLSLFLIAQFSWADDNISSEQNPISAEVSPKISKILLNSLCPKPREFKFYEGIVKINSDTLVEILSTENISDENRSKIKSIFKDYWNISPRIDFKVDSGGSSLPDEGYTLSIDMPKIKIQAKNFHAIRYALISLRQIAEPEHGTNNFVAQRAEIKDNPSIAFRGIHICIFPETTMVDLEKYVRLAAYYKYNYIILECWGVFPFKNHKEFSYQDKKLNRDDFKRIINLCKELGMTPIPQFSILGHASQSRSNSGKHVALVRHPELAELFEPAGWSWCMTNPRTDKILKELIVEIHEFFDNPPFFHIGCDEAYDMATCYECRQKNMAQLFATHLQKYRDFLAARGARCIMWHDMLIDENDPRWKNRYVATGSKEMAETLKSMPKDIIIADWQYSDQKPKETVWLTPKHFKDNGFDVIVCPWENITGIKTLAETARKEKLFGFLSTTWHHVSAAKLRRFFYVSSNAAWGTAPADCGSWDDTRVNVNKHIRTIDSDMKIEKYEAMGTSKHQIYDPVD